MTTYSEIGYNNFLEKEDNPIKMGELSTFGGNIELVPYGPISAEGGQYFSNQKGARVQIMPDRHKAKEIGLRILDANDNVVLIAKVSGSDIGDVILGETGSGSVQWDNSESKLIATNLDVTGTITFNEVDTSTIIELIEGDMDSGFITIIGNQEGLTENINGANSEISRDLIWTRFESGTTAGDDAIIQNVFGNSGNLGDNKYNVAWNHDLDMVFRADIPLNTNQDLFMGIYATGLVTDVPANSTSTDRHIGYMVEDGTLYASMANGSTQNKSAAITGVTLNDFNTYRITYDADTSAVFTINDTVVATLTNNRPSGFSDTPGLFFGVSSASAAKRYLFLANNYTIKAKVDSS